eukprot:8776121-Ditylum_brightwellii.AAC.1
MSMQRGKKNYTVKKMLEKLNKHWDLLHLRIRKPVCLQGLPTVELEIKLREEEDERKKRAEKQVKKKTSKSAKGSRRKIK